MKEIRFFIAVLFCQLSLSVSGFGQDAAMFRSNPEHTGVYEASGVRKLTGVKWQFRTDGAIISSPAVTGDLVVAGSTDKNLYAVDRATGKIKWKFATESGVTSSPAVQDGTVYFGSYDGRFYAVDADSGQPKWKFDTAGERRYAGSHLHGLQPAAESMPDPWDLYLSSPVVWHGTIYFGSGDGNVYALDTATGREKWKFQTGDVVHSSPAISEGVLFVGSWDRNLYALDASTGQEKWRFQTGDDPSIHNHIGIQSSPAVVGGMVYFGCRDGHVYAVDAKSGEQRWAYSTEGSWVNNSPAVADGTVYFGTSIPGLLHALDARSGSEVFSVETKVPVFSSIAVARDLLYVGTFDGKLTAVDLKTRKPAWVFQTEASRQKLSALTKSDGTFDFSVVLSGNFYDDMVVGVHKLLSVGAILSSPVVTDGVVYVGSADGTLYALE